MSAFGFEKEGCKEEKRGKKLKKKAKKV